MATDGEMDQLFAELDDLRLRITLLLSRISRVRSARDSARRENVDISLNDVTLFLIKGGGGQEGNETGD